MMERKLTLALMAGDETAAIDALNEAPDVESRIKALVTCDIASVSPLHRILAGDHLAVWQAVEAFLPADRVPVETLLWQCALPGRKTGEAFDRWLVAAYLDGDLDRGKRDRLLDRAILASDIDRFETLLNMVEPADIDRIVRGTADCMMRSAKSAAAAAQTAKKGAQTDDGDGVENDDIAVFGIDYGAKWNALIERVSPAARAAYLDTIDALVRVSPDASLIAWNAADLAKSLWTIVDGQRAIPERDVFEKMHALAHRFYQNPDVTTAYQGLAVLLAMRDWMDHYGRPIDLSTTELKFGLYVNACGNQCYNRERIEHLAQALAWIYDRPERYPLSKAVFQRKTLKAIRQLSHILIHGANDAASESAYRFLHTFLGQALPLETRDEETLIEELRKTKAQFPNSAASADRLVALLERRILKRSASAAVSRPSDTAPAGDRVIERARAIGI